MVDLSVAVTPLYFGTMAWERHALARRAEVEGPSAADYDRPDTTTSLAMGVLSLTGPITAYLVSFTVPFATGKGRGRSGRIGKVVLGVAATAAVATTVADRVARTADTATDAGRRLKARARQVAAVGGVAAIAGAGTVVAATSAHLTSASRWWRRKGAARDMGNGIVPWAIAMTWWDFAYYWNHRFMHQIRSQWAIHVVHHSSEHYNLSTALRQPVAGAFGVWVPYGLPARFGVRPAIIETSRALNLIYQYWFHTDTIRTMGAAEAVLNTPSHHRVHHGSNQRYLDRNHGGILITWDRLFGTFQPELPEDPVVYGLTRNIHTYNWWKVATHEYRDMFRDVAASTTWRDRLSFVLRGPGWAYARKAELAAAATVGGDGG